MDAVFSVKYPNEFHYKEMELLAFELNSTEKLGTLSAQLIFFNVSNGKIKVKIVNY